MRGRGSHRSHARLQLAELNHVGRKALLQVAGHAIGPIDQLGVAQTLTVEHRRLSEDPPTSRTLQSQHEIAHESLRTRELCDGITHEKWVLGFYGVGEPWVSELFIIKKENDDDSGVISNLASTHLRGRRSQARVVVFLRRVSAESVRSGPSLLGAAPPRAVARIAQRVGRRG